MNEINSDIQVSLLIFRTFYDKPDILIFRILVVRHSNVVMPVMSHKKFSLLFLVCIVYSYKSYINCSKLSNTSLLLFSSKIIFIRSQGYIFFHAQLNQA